MIPRRRVLGLAAMGSAIGSLGVTVAAADDTPQMTDRTLDGVVGALNSLRAELAEERSFPELRAVRQAQRDHLMVFGKFPDYVDVGVTVWMNVHDWHIRWQQPLAIERDPANRYALRLLQTLLVMRTDQLANYVGIPYDNRVQ